MRKTQVYIAGIPTMVEDSKIVGNARYYTSIGVVDEAKELEVATLKQIADGEALVESHVQEQIDIYNEANGVRFNSVDSCSKYVGQTAYEHQPFCVAILAFNCATWEAARLAQIDGRVTADTTAEEFIAMLPVFTQGV